MGGIEEAPLSIEEGVKTYEWMEKWYSDKEMSKNLNNMEDYTGKVWEEKKVIEF